MYESAKKNPQHEDADGEQEVANATDAHAHQHGPDCDHDHHHPAQEPTRRLGVKVGRNDPCGCGSGKKFKKCCG